MLLKVKATHILPSSFFWPVFFTSVAFGKGQCVHEMTLGRYRGYTGSPTSSRRLINMPLPEGYLPLSTVSKAWRRFKKQIVTLEELDRAVEGL